MITLRRGTRTIDLYVHASSYCFGSATKIVLSIWEDPLGPPFYTLTENVIPDSVRLDAASFFLPVSLLTDLTAWAILQSNQVLEPVPGGTCLADGRLASRLHPGLPLDTDARHPGGREDFLRFWGSPHTEAAVTDAATLAAPLLHKIIPASGEGLLSREMVLALDSVLPTLGSRATQRLYARYALVFDRWMGEQNVALHTIDQAGMLAYRRYLTKTKSHGAATGSWSAAHRCILAAQTLGLRADDPTAAIRGLRIRSRAHS